MLCYFGASDSIRFELYHQVNTEPLGIQCYEFLHVSSKGKVHYRINFMCQYFS